MLYLKQKLFEEMLGHSQREFPNEACGILAGKGQEAEIVYKMKNMDKSPESFFMDPKEQFAAVKDMRGRGLEMIGIYHSHPHTPAFPSAHDVRLAFYPDVSYVIVSLANKDNPSVRSFRIVEGTMKEEPITDKL